MPAGGGAPFLRLMHRVVDEYVGRREFVYDSWVPRISPKFLEPSGYDILVILHRIASVHPLSVSREAPPAATRMFVITLRTYASHPISELAGASREGASSLNVVSYSVIGWPAGQKLLPCSNTQESTMRKLHSITALCGDGLRPELQALFDRLDMDPRSELFVRDDGMVQSGPDPASETALTSVVPLRADGRPASARHCKS